MTLRLKLSNVNSNVQPQSDLQNPNAKPLIPVLAHYLIPLRVHHRLWMYRMLLYQRQVIPVIVRIKPCLYLIPPAVHQPRLSGAYMQTLSVVYNLSGPRYSKIELLDFISSPARQAHPQYPISTPANQTNFLSIPKTAHLPHKTSSLVLTVVSRLSST